MPMPIQLITDTTPQCYGVCCAKHASCARYQALEHSSGDIATIVSCDTGGGELPLFRPVAEQAQGAAA